MSDLSADEYLTPTWIDCWCVSCRLQRWFEAERITETEYHVLRQLLGYGHVDALEGHQIRQALLSSPELTAVAMADRLLHPWA